MYQIINEYDFTRAFKVMGRGDQFSYHGLQALFEWLEECNDGINSIHGVELDVIEVCCVWTQYKNIVEYNDDYETEYKTIEELDEAGVCSVIHVEGEEFICSEH